MNTPAISNVCPFRGVESLNNYRDKRHVSFLEHDDGDPCSHGVQYGSSQSNSAKRLRVSCNTQESNGDVVHECTKSHDDALCQVKEEYMFDVVVGMMRQDKVCRVSMNHCHKLTVDVHRVSFNKVMFFPFWLVLHLALVLLMFEVFERLMVFLLLLWRILSAPVSKFALIVPRGESPNMCCMNIMLMSLLLR